MSPESETVAMSPPPFGGSYAKARKAYGLSSACLLAWELIGIEIDAKPVEQFQVSLRSPQAAPYVLIALVAYFAFHFTVEWYQADTSQRRLPASIADFVAAHVIGSAAITLYGVQTLLRIQVADKISRLAIGDVGAGVSAFLTAWLLDAMLWRISAHRMVRWAFPALAVLPVVVLMNWAGIFDLGEGYPSAHGVGARNIAACLGVLTYIFVQLSAVLGHRLGNIAKRILRQPTGF
jgi:hypothetical protein